MTGEASPVRGGLALLDPLLGRPALIVEADDGPVGPRERRDDEAHPGKQFPEVMFDLGDDPSRPVPRGRLVLEAPITDHRTVASSAPGPSGQILAPPLPNIVVL